MIMRLSKEEKELAKLEEKRRELHHKEVLKEEKESHRGNKVAPSDDIIILKNVNKIYPNHVQAVFDFDLSIKENEFVVLVGPSGCGKSTTLKMIAGLEDITAGDLYINQKYANYTLSKDRNLAMVFQSYALYPTMTVYKNIAFPLTIAGVDKKTIDQKVHEISKILELDEDLLHRRPAQLSGGQRQRVALARAMIKGSKILLMDEPLSNLDAKLRATVRSEIVDLHKKLGTTTIYVTHDQVEAMTMSDRIVVMNKGYIEQIGAPQEIYDHPKTLFVATFIGSPAMNIINARLSGNALTLDNDFEIKLDKAMVKKVDQYYLDTISEIKNDIAKTIEKINKRKEDLSKEGYLQDMERLDKVSQKYAPKIAAKKAKLSKLKDDSPKKQKLEQELEALNTKYQDEYEYVKSHIAQKLYQTIPEDKLEHLVQNDSYIKSYNYVLDKQNEMLSQYNKVIKEQNKQLLFGIRAEDMALEIDKKDHNKLSNAMNIYINLCELLGHEYYLSFNINQTLCILKASAYEEILPNQYLDCYFDMEKIHLFDPISKRNIF